MTNYIVVEYKCPYCSTIFELTTNEEMKNTMCQCYACGNFLKKDSFSRLIRKVGL